MPYLLALLGYQHCHGTITLQFKILYHHWQAYHNMIHHTVHMYLTTFALKFDVLDDIGPEVDL